MVCDKVVCVSVGRRQPGIQNQKQEPHKSCGEKGTIWHIDTHSHSTVTIKTPQDPSTRWEAWVNTCKTCIVETKHMDSRKQKPKTPWTLLNRAFINIRMNDKNKPGTCNMCFSHFIPVDLHIWSGLMRWKDIHKSCLVLRLTHHGHWLNLDASKVGCLVFCRSMTNIQPSGPCPSVRRKQLSQLWFSRMAHARTVGFCPNRIQCGKNMANKYWLLLVVPFVAPCVAEKDRPTSAVGQNPAGPVHFKMADGCWPPPSPQQLWEKYGMLTHPQPSDPSTAANSAETATSGKCHANPSRGPPSQSFQLPGCRVLSPT